MVQLGASTGLLGKIPGFKQFAQMKKLAQMDLGQVFGEGGEGAPGGAMPGMAMPGMPGLGAMPGQPPMVPGLPKGYTLPGTKSFAAPVRNSDRAKDKRKRKQAKKARKKNR